MGNYEEVKEWRKRNPEKVAAQSRRRFEKHREAIYEQQRKWREANIEHVRANDAESHRRQRKLNPEAQRERMRRFKERKQADRERVAGRPQPKSCEICAGEEFRIVWDHCHVQGHFRGWICDRCNRVLGLVRDDVELLKNLARYLEDDRNG